MNAKPWGIRRRVVFLALTPVAVIAIALTGYFLFVRYGDVEAALRSRGESIVRQLGPAAEYGAFSGNRGELLRLAQSAAREPDVVAVTILDAAYLPLAMAGHPTQSVDLARIPVDAGASSRGSATEIFHATIRKPELPFDDPFQSSEIVPSAPGQPLGHVVVELHLVEFGGAGENIGHAQGSWWCTASSSAGGRRSGGGCPGRRSRCTPNGSGSGTVVPPGARHVAGRGQTRG